MYDLEVVIVGAAMPFRVTRIEDERRVQEIVEAFFAAWGIAPLTHRVSVDAQLAVQLAATGSFEVVDSGYRIIAERTH